MTNFNVVDYSDISAYARHVDKSLPIRLRLSRLQAWVLRRYVGMLADFRRGGPPTLGHAIKFAYVWGLIFVLCPKLADVGSYFRMSADILERITFQQDGKGVLVTLNPLRD